MFARRVHGNTDSRELGWLNTERASRPQRFLPSLDDRARREAGMVGTQSSAYQHRHRSLVPSSHGGLGITLFRSFLSRHAECNPAPELTARLLRPEPRPVGAPGEVHAPERSDDALPRRSWLGPQPRGASGRTQGTMNRGGFVHQHLAACARESMDAIRLVYRMGLTSVTPPSTMTDWRGPFPMRTP